MQSEEAGQFGIQKRGRQRVKICYCILSTTQGQCVHTFQAASLSTYASTVHVQKMLGILYIYVHILLCSEFSIHTKNKAQSSKENETNKQNLLSALPMETLPIEKTDNCQLQARTQRFCCYSFSFVQLVLCREPGYFCHQRLANIPQFGCCNCSVPEKRLWTLSRAVILLNSVKQVLCTFLKLITT